MDFDPSVGREIQKQCPAVLVNNDAANEHLNHVQVIPLTSEVAKVYPCEALVTFARKQDKAMADQLTTVSKLRLVNYGGELDEAEMRHVEQAIKIQLDLR